MAGTALDVLSRSLRRQALGRLVAAALAVQLGAVLAWRAALLSALTVSGTAGGKVLVLMALLGGKWATGLVTRMLSLVASGGVTSWFAQQSILLDEMERAKQERRRREAEAGGRASGVEEPASASMPEAYRSVDASVYSPGIAFDEGYDDDLDGDEDGFDDEDGFGGGGGGYGRVGRGRGGGFGDGSGAAASGWTGGGSGGRSTVRSFIVSGTTVSFGSVAQCGLLGGPAQFVWSIVRNSDALGAALSRRFSGGPRPGYRGMNVSAWDGEEDADDAEYGISGALAGGGGGGDWRDGAAALYGRFDLAARAFVRGNSDLAMSHVAAYFKSYQRAANDVAALIDASGVEPIIHDDITTRMCAAVGTAVSSVVVIFVGCIVARHRGSKDPSMYPLSDREVCEIMLICYIFCYTVVFTVMEPLRAGIKAMYVCFAQHPESLSQAFPLIFARLSRISEANLVV